MKKRLFTVILIILVFSISNFVFAEIPSYVDENGVEFQYVVKANEVLLHSIDTNKAKMLVIPAEINGYPLYNLPEGILESNNNITEIIIENGVRSIGPHCFSNDRALKKVIIPESVTSIGEFVFNSCEKLEEIRLSDNIKEIPRQAFYKCSELKKINFPPELEGIGDDAFGFCRKLESLNIPSSVKNIGNMAFDGCDLSEELVLPSGLESIGYWAFQGWQNLKKVNIPAGVTNAVDGVFMGDMALKEIAFESLSEDKFNIISNAVYGSVEADLGKARIKTSQNVNIIIDGTYVEFDEAYPYIDENYRTQIPLRTLSEKLGYKVDWNEKSKTVTLAKGEEICEFKIENRIVLSENNTVAIMDTAPVIVDDYTYIPLRYFCEVLDKNVKWDGKTNTVNITE